MSSQHTVARSLHDLGLSAWFGGSLMGAVGLNGASQHVSDHTERASVATAGWARWSPVSTGAIAAHLAGGLVLLVANRGRARYQQGVRANTVAKTVLTAAAVGATAYSGVLGARMAAAGAVHTDGGTTPSSATPEDVAATQQQLRIAQWVLPALTGALLVLSAQQGEQQQAGQVVGGLARHLGHSARARLGS